MRRLFRLLSAACLLTLIGTQARADGLTVFAAASLNESLTAAAKAWAAQGHPVAKLDFAASSTLARQIDQGAGGNLFASADEKWMDWLQKRNLIVPQTRGDLLGNTLVLVVPRNQARNIAIGPTLDLAGLLGASGRLAVGDPKGVPAGIYAQQALTKLGLWTAAEPRLARSDSVRSALLLVERGEAPAGIVYATDAAAAPDVAIAGTFPESSHDPIAYPFAILRAGDTPDARALLSFLGSPQAQAIFRAHGFSTR
jgi:molybdate transport system substrate-binding protein